MCLDHVRLSSFSFVLSRLVAFDSWWCGHRHHHHHHYYQHQIAKFKSRLLLSCSSDHHLIGSARVFPFSQRPSGSFCQPFIHRPSFFFFGWIFSFFCLSSFSNCTVGIFFIIPSPFVFIVWFFCLICSPKFTADDYTSLSSCFLGYLSFVEHRWVVLLLCFFFVICLWLFSDTWSTLFVTSVLTFCVRFVYLSFSFFPKSHG